jgi:ceramide synthetase
VIDLIKSAVDTEKTNMVVVLYLLLLSSWGYTRLYVYPMHLIYTVTIIPSMNLDISNLFLSSCTAMLCMLQVLHVYWYVLFLVMGYNLVSKGIQEDIQHKVEDKNKSQKKFK